MECAIEHKKNSESVSSSNKVAYWPEMSRNIR